MSSRKIFQNTLFSVFLSVILSSYPLDSMAEERGYSLLAQASPSESYGKESDLRYYLYSSINRTGFIRKKSVIPNGAIFTVKDENKTLISTGDIVYISPMRNSQLILGRYYVTYRTMEPMTAEETGNKFGTQYYLTGIVEITEKNPRFVIAKVIKSFRNIAIDDFLMPYTERDPKIVLTESKAGIKGEIIGPEEHSELTGEHSVVFIDKGSRDGIAPGQYYNICYQEKVRIAKEAIPLDIVDFGTILVLHAEENTATAVITRSEKNVYSGAKFHTPGE